MPSPVRALVAVLCSVAAVAAQDERAPEAFQLAIGLQQRGLHEEAARHFREFLQQQPKHALAAEAHYRLAQSLGELEQRDPAIAELRLALMAGGDNFRLRPECRYRLGNLLHQAADDEHAAQQYEALAKEVGGEHYLTAAAWYGLGESRRDLHQDEAAAAAFGKAADAATGERESYRFPALYQLGFAQTRLQQGAAAAATFAMAASVATDEAQKGECFYLSGDALLRLQEFDAAERAFQASQKLHSEFADDAMHGLAWVALGRGDQAAARRAFGKAIERFPDSPLVPTAHLECGRSFYRDQQHAEAERELQPLLADNIAADVRRQAQELLGLCALARGAGADAVKALQQSLAAAAPADRPRLSYALGEAFANLQRWQEALAAYRDVPDSVDAELRGEAHYGACFALHALGQHEPSIAEAEIVRKMQPPHRLAKQATMAVAENLFALQRYADAEREYASLADDAEQHEAVAWKLAWCRYLRGDKQDAATRFGALVGDAKCAFAEEALSMQALALLEAGAADPALSAADRYLAKFPKGSFLDRTERVAARVLRQRGDLGAAQKRLQHAASISLATGGAAAASADQVEEAELAYQQGDFRGADALFAKLAGRDDGVGARALAGRAWCAFELGDDDAALQALALAKAHPAHAAELAGLLELESALQHRRQDWPAAIAAAKQFLAQFAKHEKAPAMRYALGVAEARKGDLKDARATLSALAKDGGYERPDRVLYELAWACRRDGDEPAALATFGQLAAVSADAELVSEAKLHLGLAALDNQNLAAARPLLEAVQGQYRGKALYRLAFAEFAVAGVDKQRLATARDRFAAVAAIEGDALVGESLYLAAECCHRLDDMRGAADKLERLLETEPKHARADRARLLLGECAVRLDDADHAVPALEQFLRGGDQDHAERSKDDLARANLWLGRARMLQKQNAAAEACLVKVTELSDGPLAAEAQFRIGESREQRGDLLGAADAFVKLPILYAHEEWVRRGLLQAGLVYERLQQPDKARRFFGELIDKHAGSDEAKVAAEHSRSR